MKKVLLFSMLTLALTGPARAYYPYDMWQASQAVAKSDWARATALYEKALAEKPNAPEAHYNLAQCFYRQGKFEQAEASFKKAQELGGETHLRGQAAYNLGNTLYREKKLENALAAYKTALRWNELDDDARYNIQVILDEMKKKNPPKDDKKKDDKKKDEKKKDKDKDKKDKDKKDKGKDKPKDKSKDKDGKDKDKGKQSPPKPPPGQKPEAPPPADPSQMDKKDAERLLNYFQNRERKNAADRLPKGRPLAVPGQEDW